MASRSHKTTYTLIGFIVGCGFPLLAFLLDAGVRGIAYSIDSFLFLQRTQALHWIIDTAPIILSIAGYFVGTRQDRIQSLAQRLQSQLQERTAHQRETTIALDENRRLLSVLQRISLSVTSHHDLVDLSQALAREIVEHGIFQTIRVAVVDREAEEIRVVATHPYQENPRIDGAKTKLYRLDEDDPIALAEKTGELQVIDGWDERFRQRPGSGEGSRTVAYFIPVRHGEETVAVLHTGSPKHDRESILERIDNLQPLLNEVGIAIAYTGILSQLETSRDELADRAGHLRTLYELSASHDGQPAEQIQETLRLVTDFLSCKVGIVCRVEGETYTVEHLFADDDRLSPGDILELSKTYCEMTLRNDAPVAIHHMGQSRWRDHPSYASLQLETYIGVPLDVLGKRYGTLNFSSPHEREKPFSQSEISFIELVGRWVSAMIGRLRAERDFERFFSFSLDLFCIAGMDGYFQRLNPAFEATLGYTEEEMKSAPFIDFVHPDDVDSTLAEVEKLGQGGTTILFENRYRMKSGGYRWLSWTARPYLEEGQLFAAAHDITSLKEAQADLEHFFSLSIGLLAIAGFDGRYRRLNPAFSRILGFDNEEIVGMRYIDLVHPDDRRQTIREFARLRGGQSTFYFENRCRTKEGDYRWLAWTGVPHPQAKVAYCAAHDITRLKDTEASLELQVGQQSALAQINRSILAMVRPADLSDVARTCYDQLRRLGIAVRALTIHRVLDEESAQFETVEIRTDETVREYERTRPSVIRMWKTDGPSYRPERGPSGSGREWTDLSDRLGFQVESVVDIPHARGTIAVISDQPHAFEPGDIRYLGVVAEGLSLGITRLEDLEMLEQRNVELQAAKEAADEASRAKSDFLQT